jgi:hypothetical protein
VDKWCAKAQIALFNQWADHAGEPPAKEEFADKTRIYMTI